MYLTGESASRLLKTVLTTSAFLTLVLTGCSDKDLERTNEELQAQVDALTQRLDEVMSTDPQSLIEELSESERQLFEYWKTERDQLENLRGVLKELEDRVAASEEFEYLIPTVAQTLSLVQESSQALGDAPEIADLERSWNKIIAGLREFDTGERITCMSINLERTYSGLATGSEPPKEDCTFPIQRFGFRELMRDANSFGVWLDTISRKFEPFVK